MSGKERLTWRNDEPFIDRISNVVVICFSRMDISMSKIMGVGFPEIPGQGFPTKIFCNSPAQLFFVTSYRVSPTYKPVLFHILRYFSLIFKKILGSNNILTTCDQNIELYTIQQLIPVSEHEHSSVIAIASRASSRVAASSPSSSRYSDQDTW